MIHQLIFANPKPGMSLENFQDYWLNSHAVNFASKIPQIKRYKINTVIPANNEKPLFGGVAEIWLREEEQIASLQTKEFLLGARADEPNWAAFWETIGLDTDTHIILEGNWMNPKPVGVKLMMLIKRKEGMTLEAFRKYSLQVHGPIIRQLDEVDGYIQCHAKDGLYVVGEPRFDAVYQINFKSIESLNDALSSECFEKQVIPDLKAFVEMKYLFQLICNEHWVIGPEARN